MVLSVCPGSFLLRTFLLVLLSNVCELKATGLAWISPDDRFISDLISQPPFEECSLLFFQDGFDQRESVNYLCHSQSLTETRFKSRYLLKSNFSKDDSLSISFVNTISNFRRKSSECLIVILMINNFNPEVFIKLYNFLAPVFLPITRKDEDYFIFKVEPKLHSKLLAMEEFPGKIKFKITVGYQNHKVVVNTMCFFCNSGGEPRLSNLPVNDKGLPVKNIDYFPDFVENLNGKVLRVTLPYTRAKIEVDPPWEGVNNARRGSWKMLFDEFLMQKFNFSYHMFPSTGIDGRVGGGGSGVQLKNGSWIGATGDLIYGKADLGIVIANTPKRMHFIDFTNSFFDIGCLTYVTAQPTEIYSPAALLSPFTIRLWVAILFSLAVSMLFIKVIFFLKGKSTCHLVSDCENNYWSFPTIIQFVISTILEQDVSQFPPFPSLRCFISFWLLFTMIMTNVYRSKMVTLIAFPVVGTLPKTFDQLAFSDHQIGFMKIGDSAYNTLAASNDPVYVKILGEMEIFKGADLDCLHKVVREQKYSCISYDFALVHLREKNMSEADSKKLVLSSARTYNIFMGLATQGKSIYRLNFGKVLSYTRPSHLADVWDQMDLYKNVRLPKLNWWKETNQADKMKHFEKHAEKLGLKHVLGAFYVLFGSLPLATILFLYEILTVYGRGCYNLLL